ncbi:MAG: ArnT family glycosyltransferase [Planctomycetales bacterium]
MPSLPMSHCVVATEPQGATIGRATGAVLLIAALLRGLALWWYGEHLAEDPDAYRQIAGQLATGHGFAFGPQSGPTAYRPLLYPCLVAAGHWLGAGDERFLQFWIGGIQLGLGLLTVLLTMAVGRRLGLGRLATLAGLLVAIDPLLVYGVSQVMTETLATFLWVFALWSWLRARSRWGWLATGIACGLCVLCRPTFWASGVLTVVGWLLFSRLRKNRPSIWGGSRNRASGEERGVAGVHQDQSGRSPWLAAWGSRPFVLIGLGFALAVLPWVGRNILAFGKPILTTTHGGYTLLLPHNPFYTRAVVDQPWGAVWEVDADGEWHDWLQRHLAQEHPPIDVGHHSPENELRRDRLMNRMALDYVAAEPGIAVRAAVTLLGRFWSLVPQGAPGRSVPPALSWGIGGYYLVVFLAALAGCARLKGDAWGAWWPALALVASFTAVHAIYWADMRMRAPLMPVLCLLAVRSWLRDSTPVPSGTDSRLTRIALCPPAQAGGKEGVG